MNGSLTSMSEHITIIFFQKMINTVVLLGLSFAIQNQTHALHVYDQVKKFEQK